MNEENLLKLAGEIKEASLREKVTALIRDPRVTIEAPAPGSPKLKESPASKQRHHSYRTGLIVHTVSTARLALHLADLMEEVYGAKVDRDTVIAACLLHDLFKPATYTEVRPGEYAPSRLAERLDHLSIIIGELYARRFPLEVIHAVAAHHGRGSPIEPRTLEALVVHLSDTVDAEINDRVLMAAKNIIKECTGIEVKTLPQEVSPFKVVLAKKDGGCEEVRRKFSGLL